MFDSMHLLLGSHSSRQGSHDVVDESCVILFGCLLFLVRVPHSHAHTLRPVHLQVINVGITFQVADLIRDVTRNGIIVMPKMH